MQADPVALVLEPFGDHRDGLLLVAQAAKGFSGGNPHVQGRIREPLKQSVLGRCGVGPEHAQPHRRPVTHGAVAIRKQLFQLRPACRTAPHQIGGLEDPLLGEPAERADQLVGRKPSRPRIHLGLGQEARVVRLEHPTLVCLAHPLQNCLVLGRVGQIMDLVGIALGIVELFRRLGWAHQERLRPAQLALGSQAAELLARGRPLGVVAVLHDGPVGQVVADVLVTLVADRTAHLVDLVDPVPHGEHVLARLGSLIAQECQPLHIIGNSHPDQAQHRGGEVDEADQPIDGRPRRAGRPAPVFFGKPNHQRHPDPRVVKPAFMAGQAVAVVRIEEDDRLVGKAVLFQLPKQITRLLVHRGNQVVEVGHVAADHGRIGIIGRQRNLRRIVPLMRRKPGGPFGELV